MDAGTQAQVLARLGELARTRRMGLLLVSHDLAVVAQFTDRVAVMQAGEIVEQGATVSTLGRLRHPYSRALLAPFHLLDVPPGAAARRRQVAAVLQQVGLSAADAPRRPHEFSGGQRQRIAIARALITEPAVVVFDEALSALDVLVRAQILELLAELADRLQLAYLFVTHDLSVVRAIADRVYVMQRGRIVEQGPTQALFTAPVHAHTRMLLGAMPRWSLERGTAEGD